MAPTIPAVQSTKNGAETHSIFDASGSEFSGYPIEEYRPITPTSMWSGTKDRLVTITIVAVGVAALLLVLNAVLATMLLMSSNRSDVVYPVAPVGSAETLTTDVDATCVAVLKNGGRPQDCARMYLTSEFPGYPR